MVEKLKLVLKSPRLVLLLKGLLFGFLIAWLAPGASLSRAVIFVLLVALLYLRPLFNGLAVLRSFLILLALSVSFPESIYGFNVLPAVHGVLFLLIMGLKEFVLVHRVFWHEALFAVLAYEILVLHSFFYAQHPLITSVAVALALMALLSELINRETAAPRRKAWVASWVFALLALSGLWIAGFLPLGFWNTVNLVALGMLFFVEMLLRFYNGKLTRAMVVSRVIIFVLLLTIIFLTSRWHL